MFGETPLLFVYFEVCHYNSSFPTNMPQNTYGHGLGPAADVYEDVYFIVASLSPITNTWAAHVIFFFLLSSPHLPLLSVAMAMASSSSSTRPSSSSRTRPSGARGLGGSRLNAGAPLLLVSPPARSSRSRSRARPPAPTPWPVAPSG